MVLVFKQRLRNSGRHIVAVCAFVLAASFSVWAADIRVQVDPASAQVAEPIWLTLVVRAPQGTSVVFPDVPESVGPFQVRAHRDWPDVPVGNQREWTRHLKLESFQSGELQVPPLSVSVDGQTLKTKTLAVSITSEIESKADPLKFRDIKLPLDIPPPEEEESDNLLPWAVAATLIVLGAACTLLFLRRKRTIAPGVWAMRELTHMRQSESFRREDAPQLVPEIAGILREYVERQFDIRATRQTTEEFLVKAQSDPRLSVEQQSLVQKFLQRVDEIKFAQRSPDPDRLDDSYQLVHDFVQATSGDVK